LLKMPGSDEVLSWNNVLINYTFDPSDKFKESKAKEVTGMVVLISNAKTLEHFVAAGGSGGMKCKDGTDRTYLRTKGKMLQVLKSLQFVPFFVRPHASKFLVAPLAGFPFHEELICSSYLNARSWLVLPANQVITKLEPLLESLGAPFLSKVFKRLPRDGGVELWQSFYDTAASDEVSSRYIMLRVAYT
jgi:hypothetical protein